MFKLTSILVLVVLVTDSIGQYIIFPTYRPSSDPVIILPTYIPPPQEPIIRTARDAPAQESPLRPSMIDDVRLDPDRRYARSVSPSSSGSGDRRMKRDIYDPFIPRPSPFPYPIPSGPFNPNPPTRPFPIYAKY
ncbi:lebocin-1/2-like [Maniola jurtina]|uniref:lebocin-1/2-like n=1 Tax=Maniola jurtina TaxID=191418 RepID=UPI001E687727|nr:lebocin-1/2-like [Maniola jurtina]